MIKKWLKISLDAINEEEKKKALERYEIIRKKYMIVSEQYQKGDKKMILK